MGKRLYIVVIGLAARVQSHAAAHGLAAGLVERLQHQHWQGVADQAVEHCEKDHEDGDELDGCRAFLPCYRACLHDCVYPDEES
ncbi:hypothetical protein D3C75_1180290 [compost metagenome]